MCYYVILQGYHWEFFLALQSQILRGSRAVFGPGGLNDVMPQGHTTRQIKLPKPKGKRRDARPFFMKLISRLNNLD